MTVARRLACAACVAVAIAACGGGSETVQTTTTGTTTTSTTTPAPPTPSFPVALSQRILHSGELAGMQATGAPTLQRDPQAWIAAQGLRAAKASAEVARLERLGFVVGVGENLITPGNANRFGLSLLEQFSSHASAQAELAHQSSASATGIQPRYFAVPGIPGARGYETPFLSTGGRNVAFVQGPYYMIVVAGWKVSARNDIGRARLIAAAQRLYRRALAAPGP